MALEQTRRKVETTLYFEWAPDEETVIGYPQYSTNQTRKVVVKLVKFTVYRLDDDPWQVSLGEVAFVNIKKDGSRGATITEQMYYDTAKLTGFESAKQAALALAQGQGAV